ncbi:tRNA pseudouridine synthase B [Desulforamulus reducens MI-1]|uniref:tRNA pseudouridine synthase B n=1 Tax=Desulforamulus reducens (strain ATCC BAA-1160 / DSM 100696 / MI-1) TaxID=349161 RepID=A4J5W9_DESRM|nr:tRNA pseudouridine(55) synthase TruB [Desulforamulus reducens]ABO50472.1 tRNA pseudouridine synthase B [Desulforamulus reducens MI-1]
MDGVINILKPPGMTSHDVVFFVRRVTGVKKCGHTGTLDPGASGVLPVCVGKATRLARFVTDGDKTYRAEITLGIETSSQDAFGNVISRIDASAIKLDDFSSELRKFQGEIKQTPPMASAIKVKGKKLYELEREGIIVDVPTRTVTIYQVNIVDSWDWGTPNPRVLFDVACSKGTYVRTLCSDIGKELGCGAYMSFLLRSRVAAFGLHNAYTLEEIAALADKSQLESAVIPMAKAVQHLPIVEIHPSAQKSVCSGATLYPAGVRVGLEYLKPEGLVQVQLNHELLGIYKPVLDVNDFGERIILRPEVVFAS